MADEMVPGESEDSEGFKPKVKGKGSIKRFSGTWEGWETDSKNPERKEEIEWKMTVEIGSDCGIIKGGSDFDFLTLSNNKVTVFSVKVSSNTSFNSLLPNQEADSNYFNSLEAFEESENLNKAGKMGPRLSPEEEPSFQAGSEEKFTLSGSFNSAEQFVYIDKHFPETGRKVTYKGDLKHNIPINKNQPLNSYEADDLPFIEGSYEEFKGTERVEGVFFLRLKTPVDM